MNKLTSLYLDSLRVFAAFGVLFVHANLPSISNNLFLPPEMGHKLVMIFFVLSGFLIAFTVGKVNITAKKYLVDRFSRLYCVVLPALIFTYFIDVIGLYYNPSIYENQISNNNPFFRFLISLLFLNQSWTYSIRPSSNGPFWSISYEFWYYMIFAAYYFLIGRKKYFVIILLCFIAGLKILLLLPVWLLGVYAYKSVKKYNIQYTHARLLFLISLSVILFFTFVKDFSVFEDKFIFGQAPLFFSSRFIFDWFYGIFVAINLFSINHVSVEWSIPSPIAGIIKYLSSITFSLYMFHFPLLLFSAAVIPYDKSNYFQVCSILTGIFLVVIAISFVTEKQRTYWKMFFEKFISEFISSSYSSKITKA